MLYGIAPHLVLTLSALPAPLPGPLRSTNTTSTSTKSTTCRWGIVGLGWISNKFVIDLLSPPETREVSDVQHVVHAVASRSADKGPVFLKAAYDEAGAEGAEKVISYGSYDELFADPNVDCVYIGTPHSHHYAQVHAALTAGKNVLCEKAFVVNTKQAQILVDLARKQGLFLMEAVWTRFQPVSYKLQEILRSGEIGLITGVQSELCANFAPTALKDPGHRLVNPDLCGGALYDLGPYPWTQLALVLLPPSTASTTPIKPLKLAATLTKTTSGVDAHVVAGIQFPQEDGRTVIGTLTTSQIAQTPHHRVTVVHGTLGYLEVQWATYRPEGIKYVTFANEDDYAANKNPVKTIELSFSERPGKPGHPIWGFAWEADEVARCLRDGKKESDRMPLRETILMMEAFEEIRKQGELVYPEAIETTDL